MPLRTAQRWLHRYRAGGLAGLPGADPPVGAPTRSSCD
ncbi:helix-turn-helix domain-containing protein [Nocardia sp. NPDC004260]